MPQNQYSFSFYQLSTTNSHTHNYHLLSLIAKQTPTHPPSNTDHTLSLRHDVVLWICRVSSLYGFTALTTVLAVNYFDRFVTSLSFQSNKPWMSHLAAVACLSLAAKMEETQVPLLLDLQVEEESEFVFEPKTIQRMELLVLSTLKWRMNPVTPISFFQHFVTSLDLHSEFLCSCQRVLLCVIADSRVMMMMSYLPSTLAAAIMIHVIKEIEPFNATEYRIQVLSLLKCSEEQVNECYKLLLCCEGIHNLRHKRKRISEPGSPDVVIDASFSCDSSNDSGTVASSVSVSPEPAVKKTKVQEQRMRLPLVNRVSVDVLSSPR